MLRIDGTSEYEKVITYIYHKMQSGELIVGSKLPTERDLAKELGVGRNSAREALSILTGMGMVKRVHGSGNYITKNAHRAIQQIITMTLALGTISDSDILEFRRNMEKTVCQVVMAKGLSEKQKAYIKEIVSKMEKSDQEESLSLDKEFHDSLIKATDNPIFITILEAITEVYREEMREVIEKTDDDTAERLLKIHEGIYKGIADEDRSKALSYIEEHFNLVEEMISC